MKFDGGNLNLTAVVRKIWGLMYSAQFQIMRSNYLWILPYLGLGKKPHKVINSIISRTKADLPVDPKDYYPQVKKRGGKTRELPIVDHDLIGAIQAYLDLRQQTSILKPNAPLLLS